VLLLAGAGLSLTSGRGALTCGLICSSTAVFSLLAILYVYPQCRFLYLPPNFLRSLSGAEMTALAAFLCYNLRMAENNKFNENIQIFNQEQLSKILNELDLDPQKVAQVKKTAPPKNLPPDPSQSAADILKQNFIASEEEE
jgi:hypothetical protein